MAGMGRAVPAGRLIYAAARGITERRMVEEEIRKIDEKIEILGKIRTGELVEKIWN